MSTNRTRRSSVALAALALASLTACAAEESTTAIPSFSLAWSEYPSWSVFGVADELGVIDGEKGAMGEIETRWNVDIVLEQKDYDPCIGLYAQGTVDAVCITNMDVLAPSVGRTSVAILPTSRSHGADACITVGIDTVEDLKGKKVYGLESTVSEYCFVRNIEELGMQESDFVFTNMDPANAAQALQQGQEGVEAIVVWNPFLMSTLEKRPDAKVLFDSTTIPGEIIDMVVVGKSSLEKDGGDRFAAAVIDAYQAVCERMADPATREDTLVALGAKFSQLDGEAMAKVVTQTVFYSDPAEGKALFGGEELKATMEKVIGFCVDHDVVQSAPSVGYGDANAAPNANLRFDPSFIDLAGTR